MTDMTAADAAQVRRIVPRIRRFLADSPAGVARASLRRRISSREKHLFDVALDLLLAVGDIVADPIGGGGTRYRLADATRKTQPERPFRQETTP